MDPVAFTVGPLSIRWYGVFVALGFLAGFAVIQYRSRFTSIDRQAAADMTFTGMVGGLIGARLLYVVQNWSEFRGNWLEMVRIDHGGLVFFGGFLGGIMALAIVCRVRGWSPADVGDLFAPALPLGHALGRIGCFLNGCCFGRPWHGPCAVRYAPDSAVAYVQRLKGIIDADAACEPVFPVQLASSAINLGIVAVLLAAAPRLPRRGLLFPLYLMLFAIARFAVEFMRGDYVELWGPLTPAQVLCLAAFPAGLAWFVWVLRRTGDRRKEHA